MYLKEGNIIHINEKSTLLFIVMIFYKILLDIGFLTVLVSIDASYTLDFNVIKYLVGFFSIIVLFLFIDHDRSQISSLAFELHLFIGIIPLSVIYSFCNESSIYFLAVCAAFLTATVIFCFTSNVSINFSIRIQGINLVIFACFAIVIMVVWVYVVIKNGLPTVTALDINNVYELRRENFFIQNKYIGYIYSWMMYVILPFIISYCLTRKKYAFSTIAFLSIIVLYLYSGNKTSLFSIPLILVCYIISKHDDTNLKIFSLFSLGVLASTILFWMCNIYVLYSLFVRRLLLLPAQIKFYYYDFFSIRPKIGLETTLWGSIFGFKPKYPEGVANTIGAVYYNHIDCNANTGFIAEGYMRFGIVGIFIAFLVFAFVLYLLDILQKKTGYVFSVTATIYVLYSLNDGSIIDPIIFGPFLILCLICIFYYKGEEQNEEALC
ncbi:MAG: oligosaccharide repeat unit polymerase [Clostridiales bacterium]|nr:oligosaccharide repeat unit polymerase [Clostridiales bacterium]